MDNTTFLIMDIHNQHSTETIKLQGGEGMKRRLDWHNVISAAGLFLLIAAIIVVLSVDWGELLV